MEFRPLSPSDREAVLGWLEAAKTRQLIFRRKPQHLRWVRKEMDVLARRIAFLNSLYYEGIQLED